MDYEESLAESVGGCVLIDQLLAEQDDVIRQLDELDQKIQKVIVQLSHSAVDGESRAA